MEFGIEFTARHASALGYYSVAVRDGVSSWRPAFHEASLRFMEVLGDVVTSETLVEIWDARRAVVAGRSREGKRWQPQ